MTKKTFTSPTVTIMAVKGSHIMTTSFHDEVFTEEQAEENAVGLSRENHSIWDDDEEHD